MLLWACYLHAFAAVMVVGGIMYWVQFHYKMGPVAINISRILLDVVTMAVIFMLINFAFSVGLAFVHSTVDYVVNNSTTPPSYVLHLMLDFGWATLAPGPPGSKTDIKLIFLQISTLLAHMIQGDSSALRPGVG